MTIINTNSISGINSITAQGASGVEFFDSSGNSVQTVNSDGLTVGTGATIGGSTNTITASTNGSERLRIKSDGKVGIGTDNPGNVLHVQKNGGDAILELQNSGNGNHSGIFFVRESSAGVNKGAANIHVESNTSGSGSALVFGCGSNINPTGSERLRINSSGSVGIGTDNPTKALHIAQNSDCAIRIDANNSNTNARTWEIAVGGNASNNAEMVLRTRQDNGTGGSECARFTRSGGIKLPSGGGIDFHNYGTGANIDSNLLDDYEEGTWTPDIVLGTVSGHNGHYTKVGRLVTVSGYVNNFSDRSSSSPVRVSGLPFADGNSNDACCGSFFGRYISKPYYGVYMSGDTLYFYGTVNTDYNYVEHDDLSANAGATIYFTATYQTNE